MNYFYYEIIHIKVKMSISGADLCYVAVAEDVCKKLDSIHESATGQEWIHESANGQEWIDSSIILYEYVLHSSLMKNSVFRNIMKKKIIETEIVTLSYFKNLRDDFESSSNRRQYRSVIDLLDLLGQMRNMY